MVLLEPVLPFGNLSSLLLSYRSQSIIHRFVIWVWTCCCSRPAIFIHVVELVQQSVFRCLVSFLDHLDVLVACKPAGDLHECVESFSLC